MTKILTPAQFRLAVAYNEDVWDFVTSEEAALLAAHWQAAHGLVVDGKYGPITKRNVCAAIPRDPTEELLAKVLDVARQNLGYGETGANNSGEFIRAIGGRDGMLWCALVVGYCYRRAAELVGVDLPFDPWRRPGVPEAGAKELARRIAAAGRRFTDPLAALPGDVFCLHRGETDDDPEGHVGLIESVDADGLLTTLEGNVGRFPAKFKRRTRDLTEERLCMLASLRKEPPSPPSARHLDPGADQ